MVQQAFVPILIAVTTEREPLEKNRIPVTDLHDSPTGCCPRFHPERWDEQVLHFEQRLFARAMSRNVKHVPQDLALAYADAASAIEKARAWEEQQLLVLNRMVTARDAEHLFLVGRNVPGLQMVRLDGEYRTRLFEGDYQQVPHWQAEFEEDLAARGMPADRVYFHYTSCPKCAEAYGRNYVVAVAKMRP